MGAFSVLLWPGWLFRYTAGVPVARNSELAQQAIRVSRKLVCVDRFHSDTEIAGADLHIFRYLGRLVVELASASPKAALFFAPRQVENIMRS